MDGVSRITESQGEERDCECGYDWTFAPVKPADPEYRMAYSELQKVWLLRWVPRVGAWIQ